MNSETVQNIFLLCGTNNVDNILNSPIHLRNKVLTKPENSRIDVMTDTFNCIDTFIQFLHQWAPNATVNVLRVLPRESRTRNQVITRINCFISSLTEKYDYVKQSDIDNDRMYLFAYKSGFRKSHFFSNNGDDNVHLNEKGVVRLAKYLKYRVSQKKPPQMVFVDNLRMV